MKVLSLTHAHLKTDGLSPVSCERADSLVDAWGDRLNWDIDLIHTRHTRWVGIWPDGRGLKVNIVSPEAPHRLMMDPESLFSVTFNSLLQKRHISDLISLIIKKVAGRLRTTLSNMGLTWPGNLIRARRWGNYLAELKEIKGNKYDFIFVCVGYGDEYLLETGLSLSEKLSSPMIVDFRDLWSDHHDPGRLTAWQKKLIRSYEKKLLVKTILISVPQNHMAVLLKKWVKCSVYVLSHSAYVGKDWPDGDTVHNEFRMLYAGKLYASGPGLQMLFDLIKKLKSADLNIPFKCYFFVDDTKLLASLAAENSIGDQISINEWVSPQLLWKELRSAHLMLVPDPGLAENYPLLPTKTYQYAYTGRQILCLFEYKNDEMQEFLNEQKAGIVCYNTNDAASWVKELAKDELQYQKLPPLRYNMPTRDKIAWTFGREIEKLIPG